MCSKLVFRNTTDSSTVCSTPYLELHTSRPLTVHIWNVSRSNWGRTTTGRLCTQHSIKKKKKPATSNPDIRHEWYGSCFPVRLEFFMRDVRTSSNCYPHPHLECSLMRNTIRTLNRCALETCFSMKFFLLSLVLHKAYPLRKMKMYYLLPGQNFHNCRTKSITYPSLLILDTLDGSVLLWALPLGILPFFTACCLIT